MRRKGRYICIVAALALLCVSCAPGAEKRGKDKEKIRLVWKSYWDFWKNEEYFNQLLEEKGYPYEVTFVTDETAQEGQTVDIMDVGTVSWETTYDTDRDALDGKVIALDEYLQTEKGKEIKESVPKKLWDTYKIAGKQYSLLTPGAVPFYKAYIWNTKLAEKYDVHPEKWDQDIWNYKEELTEIAEQEIKAGNKGFLAVSGLFWYALEVPEMTQALGTMYPLTVRETDEEMRAEFFYETKEFQERLAKTKEFYEVGLCDQEKENAGAEAFVTLDTVFWSKNAYLASREDNFWDTHDVKKVSQERMWEVNASHMGTGITSKSEKPQEAFDLLYLLYTDEELVNALAWGKEGKDYEVVDGKAVKPGTEKDYIPHLPVGNMLLAYPELTQDKNLKELYQEATEEAQLSRLSGFRFHGKNVQKELEEVAGLYYSVYGSEAAVVMNDMESVIRQYKEAGIDKIVDEWNRQFAAWRKESR